MDLFTAWGFFVHQPAWALVPALFFAALYGFSRSRTALATAVLWLVYTGLETGNKLRWTCSGECNIRIDLFLIAPALTLASAAAIMAALVRLIRRRRA